MYIDTIVHAAKRDGLMSLEDFEEAMAEMEQQRGMA
jgi:hypothetical protein